MTTIELKNKLVLILPEYEFTDSDGNIFGTKKIKHRTFRDGKKNLVRSFDRTIFISSEMYPNTDKNFRYAINYTKSKMRNYRCNNWYESEYKKVFVSGKTEEMLLEEIKQNFN